MTTFYEEIANNKEGYIISEEYKPCTWCKTPTNIVEVCSEGYFCSKECEDAFMDYLMKLDKEGSMDIGELLL